jgi:hypothetical protein
MTTGEITLRILCRNLPGAVFEDKTAVRLGIQKGKEVIEDVPADSAEATFTVPLTVKRKPEEIVTRFYGPFVQGKSDDPFIYLCWGERIGTVWAGFGRAKLLLGPLTSEAVEKARQSGCPIEAVIDLTDAKGRPVYASIPADRVHWDL